MYRKWFALAGVAVAVLAVGLDGTILAVALPTLAKALDASATDLVWFSSAYLLTWAAAMLPLGALGDRVGRKKVMLGSLVVFGAASAWAALADTPLEFIAARALAGAAGAGIVVMALAAVTVLFEEGERQRAFGVWAAVNFVALPAGPLLGGWLLAQFWWGWVFVINVPMVLIALVAGAVLVPDSRGVQSGPVDIVGILGLSAGLAGIVFGFAQTGELGWLSPEALVPLVGGLLVILALGRWEWHLARSTTRQPLIDLGLFRVREFAWGTVLAAIASLAMIGLIFALPQYFQAVLDANTIGSGLLLLPLIGGLVIGAAVAEPFVKAVGNRSALTVGFVVLAAGLGFGALTTAGSGLPFLILWTALSGLGLGLNLSTATAAALAPVPAERAGIASAMVQALQEVGSPLGVAVLGAVTIAGYRSSSALSGLNAADASAVRSGVFDGLAAAERLGAPALARAVRLAFVDGVDAALAVSAGIAVVGAIIAISFFPRRAPGVLGSADNLESHAVNDGLKGALDAPGSASFSAGTDAGH